VWPTLSSDVAKCCRPCQDCQWAKVMKQPPASVQPIPVPVHCFSHVFLTSAWWVLYTLWQWAWPTCLQPWTAPLCSTSAADFAEAFTTGWISRYGVPTTIISNHGGQASSSFWASVMTMMGTSNKFTPAFHPQRGVIQLFHCCLKDPLSSVARS
jgi:hypothetical protein